MELNETFNKAVEASRALNLTDVSRIDAVLLALADAAEAKMEFILEANRRDLALMDEQNPMYDRLMLTPERIRGIAADIRNVASLPSPLGHVLDEVVRPNGMKITKISVPFGVIGVIYEARPNVSFDVVSLCLKSGNACVLKGGHDAGYSNEAIVKVIREVLQAHGMDEHTVTLLPADRAATAALLGAVGYIDLLIPRGSKGLIDYVRDNARIPVIETGAGICHTYFDAAGDRVKCADIVFNAKTRRVSVCNALDCLIVHRDRLGDLPAVCGRLAAKEVVIYADSDAYAVLDGRYPARLLERATAESFGTEFLSYPSGRSLHSTRRSRTLPVIRRSTARRSSARILPLSAFSNRVSMRRVSMRMCLPPLPMAPSSDSVPKSVSVRRNFMHAVRWRYGN